MKLFTANYTLFERFIEVQFPAGSGLTLGITGPKPHGYWLPCETRGEAPVHAFVRRPLEQKPSSETKLFFTSFPQVFSHEQITSIAVTPIFSS
jgi:hypothetical protein